MSTKVPQKRPRGGITKSASERMDGHLTIRLPDKLQKLLAKRARERMTHSGVIVRQAIQAYLTATL